LPRDYKGVDEDGAVLDGDEDDEGANDSHTRGDPDIVSPIQSPPAEAC
jgi:hypothetical protein